MSNGRMLVVMANFPEVEPKQYMPLEGASDPVVWQKVISPAAGMVLGLYAKRMHSDPDRIPRLSDLLRARTQIQDRLFDIRSELTQAEFQGRAAQVDEAELMNLHESEIEFGRYVARPDVSGYIPTLEKASEATSAQTKTPHLRVA